MIGFTLRLLSFGLLDTGSMCALCGGGLCAILMLCGLYKCAQCRMRDCSCIKRLLRATGSDEFDDFSIMVIVHDATFTATSRKTTRIELCAGDHKISTSDTNKGIYQEALQMEIEQGSTHLVVRLMDYQTELAVAKLDIVQVILKNSAPILEQEFTMKPKQKGITNPKVRLTMRLEKDGDQEKSLLSDMNLSKESEMLLQQALHRNAAQSGASLMKRGSMSNLDAASASNEPAKPLSALQTLVQGLKGNLDMFGTLGKSSRVWVEIQGPPLMKKYQLCIFPDSKESSRSTKPSQEVDVLKILSVQEDPGRSDVFIVNYMTNNKVKERLSFQRLDLPAQTWVELLTKLIKLVREERESKSGK